MNAAATIADYVQEKLPGEPVRRRIKLTRALAALETDRTQASELEAIADDLERAEKRQQRLKFRGGES